MEHDLDGNTTEAKGPPVALEIDRARPDVRAVVHGHTPSLPMFSSSRFGSMGGVHTARRGLMKK